MLNLNESIARWSNFTIVIISMLVLSIIIGSTGCQSEDDKLFNSVSILIKGRPSKIPLSRINSGKLLYLEYCQVCHGANLKNQSTGPPVGHVLRYRSIDYMKNFLKFPRELISSKDTMAVCTFNDYYPVLKGSIFEQYYNSEGKSQITYFREIDESDVDRIIENICYWIQYESEHLHLDVDSLNTWYECNLINGKRFKKLLPASSDYQVLFSVQEFKNTYSKRDRLELYILDEDIEGRIINVAYNIPQLNIQIPMIKTESSGFILLGSQSQKIIEFPSLDGEFTLETLEGGQISFLTDSTRSQYYLSYDKSSETWVELIP
ncbi:c-type cytochrome [Neolewinella antarctica]|uniref:Cytochrome c domain-containing protein n=1 Tax=Neolewinella antarctica TaxID=442734 RepID=A0ABX0XHB8_9BACT|nr:hypothetical protein [Neolewinella antarctica]NJC28279.1 hypothetical protein [Neolewinella antarctica]